VVCPFGEPGDRLWVRESGVINKLAAPEDPAKPGLFRHDVPARPDIGYYWMESTRATGARYNVAGCSRAAVLLSPSAKACPPIHMPHWASRITLEVTGVRVERLQDITEFDAIDEGALDLDKDWLLQHFYEYFVELAATPPEAASPVGPSPRKRFEKLWDSLNAERGYGWDRSPWVWVVEFERIAP
jgi:hypothetical protein